MATTANIDLKSFKDNVKDLARPNRFLVTFYGLSEAKTGMVLPENYQYYVRSASLPVKTIPDIGNLYWFGLQYKFGGDPTFETITLKFINNQTYDLRLRFEQWMDVIAHTVDNTRGEPGGDTGYKTSMALSQLNNSNEVSASYLCEGLYPTSISTMELNHDTNSAVEEFDVTFNLDYFSNGSDSGTVLQSDTSPATTTL